ncbi:hypothetical protein [Komagataeibacter oboediens]|uniref:hypothetical protein n=1 Tax=Komagataeibacter oboediens TaxID=65958 RepID=UPI0012F4A372|nr:hypothetical protein [Komagataeibacter oboediens]
MEKKSGSILTVSCAEDELKIQEVREGECKGQRWIIPSLINVELLQKHEITWTERDSISVKNPKYFLLCTYMDVQKPDLSGFSSVPLVGQWVLNDTDNFSIEDCGKLNFPWNFLTNEMLEKITSKAIDDANRHWSKDN